VTELLGKTASRASDDEVAPGQVYSDRDVGRCRTHDLALRALAAFGGTDAVLADAGDCPSAGHLRALLELGPRATKAVPSLLDSTAKAVRDGIARDALTVVLMAIGPSVLGPLVDRVKRPDAPLSLKTLLLRMVTRFPTDSAAALPVIAELAASDGSADMRKQADDVLSALRRREPTGGR
jgi:hypothetical protein